MSNPSISSQPSAGESPVRSAKRHVPLAIPVDSDLPFVLTDSQYVSYCRAAVLEAVREIAGGHPELNNEQVYDVTYARLFGDTALTGPQLLTFMTFVSDSLREILRALAAAAQAGADDTTAVAGPSEVTLPTRTSTTISLSLCDATRTLNRLARVRTFEAQHAVGAQIYCLSDFCGCTEEEIAGLLDLPVTEVVSRLMSANAIIRAAE
jgi:hypothetical protein